MRYIDDPEHMEKLPGTPLAKGDRFAFRCHPDIGCFNQCCRNLNLFLYPYDVVRLKNRLGISSDAFLDRHVDVVMRPDNHFPEVLLRMADNAEATCPFLSGAGCEVYPDRPGTCRDFPVEHGVRFDADSGRSELIHFFRPPDFCLGKAEDRTWTLEDWAEDQEAESYNRQTLRWIEIKRLFIRDPWGPEGPNGQRARMAFMAAYNIDRFREFVFNSSFSKRFKVKPAALKRARIDDDALLAIGLAWIELFVWGKPSSILRQKR